MRPDRRCRVVESGAVPFRLVLGLLVMTLGVIFLGENLGYFDAREAFHIFWPAAFVIVGVVVLVGGGARRSSRYWGLLWIVAGGWIWAYQQEWVDVDFWDLFFPGVLVLLGGSLIWRSFVRAREKPAADRDPQAEIRSFAIMSGTEVRSTSDAFRSADLGAVMGGVTLDLRQAKMAAAEATIDLFAVWGGIEIRVPREWTVASKVMPLMAGFEDKTEPATGGSPRRLVIRGLVVMGGVEVTN